MFRRHLQESYLQYLFLYVLVFNLFFRFRRLSLGFQFVQQSRIAIAHCMHAFIQVSFSWVLIHYCQM